MPFSLKQMEATSERKLYFKKSKETKESSAITIGEKKELN
jgi:hypothetical protein